LDIFYFLRLRLQFTEKFYETAAEPFLAEMKKIEQVEEPYTEVDPEGGEPPYQHEWNDCYESLDVLGQHCIGMLGTSLRLYLDSYTERMNKLGINLKYKRRDNKGWLHDYKKLFLEEMKIDWDKSPVNIGILEQILLARNDFEHNTDIATMAVYQNEKHFEKYKDSFFADNMELQLYRGKGSEGEEFLPFAPWHLNVSHEQLLKAIEEVRNFCAWLEAVWRYYPDFLEGKDVSPITS